MQINGEAKIIAHPCGSTSSFILMPLRSPQTEERKRREMASISVSLLLVFLPCLWIPLASTPDLTHESFMRCLSYHALSPTNISRLLYTRSTSCYLSVLLSSIQNFRFTSPKTPKPLFIVTPTDESHVQASVLCARERGLEIRVRSGGHDYEGLSYRAYKDLDPFVLLDLALLRSVSVDLEYGTAWAEAGATLGELYYHIAEKSSLRGFPGGVCSTIGLGGYISGGGFGTMMRKHGLAADNVLDAKLIDAFGRLLDRESMGEDLFWAIRGGGGASFGIIVSWKLRLVPVPPTVTVFTIHKSKEQGAIELVNKWQYIAPQLSDDIFLEAVVQTLIGGMRGTEVLFNSFFFGGCSELLQLMNESFPELGMKRSDCKEMSWIRSALYFAGYTNGKPLEALLDRSLQPKSFYKGKSDFVQEPIPISRWEEIWDTFQEEEAAVMYMDPYGGRMSEIPEEATPFPHRKGNLYNIQYLVAWNESGSEASKRHLGWIRSLYREMSPYVSKHPRASYVNFRDLDLGRNEGALETMSFSKAEVWGKKYFKHNFERLAFVKGEADPLNFFKHEQSIPPLFAGQGRKSTRMGMDSIP